MGSQEVRVNTYAVVYEPVGGRWRAILPDFPGLAVVAMSQEEARSRLIERVSIHVAELRADGYLVPEPTAKTDFISISV